MSAVVEYKEKAPAPSLKLAPAKANPADDAILEFESPSAAVIATPPVRLSRGMSWIISALVLSIVAVVGVIPVDIVVTATGKVVSKAPTVVVQPFDQSIVRSIDVKVGQLVHRGDLLARLDPTLASADLRSLEQQVASYQAQVDRDKAETEGKPYYAKPNDPASQLQAALYAQQMSERNFKLEDYRQKINSLELQIARDLATAAYYRQRLGVAGDLEGMRLTLQKMLVGSKLESLLATDNRLEITRNMALTAATAESEKRDLQALIAEREAYDNDWHNTVLQDLQTTQPLLDQAKENLKKARLHAQLVELRADQDAIVQSIALVSVGSVLQPGQQFVTLVPSNAPLEVEADVLGSDAGYVREGDPVVVKFDTFPYNLYGWAEGKVRVISPDSVYQSGAAPLATADAGTGAPIASGPQGATPGAIAYFVDRVSLDTVKLHDTPPGFHITPGMPVTADIKTGKRTVLTYVLSRVLPVAQEGMREP